LDRDFLDFTFLDSRQKLAENNLGLFPMLLAKHLKNEEKDKR
jgi:hypothetical protein